MNKRIYLSRNDKKLSGVCGGIGEYLDMDPTIVRLLWVFFTFASGGLGLIIYIIAAVIMTEEPTKRYIVEASTEETQEEYVAGAKEYHENHQQEVNKPINKNNHLIFGLVLVLLGGFLLSRNFFGWHWFNFRLFFPTILILSGIFVLVNGRK